MAFVTLGQHLAGRYPVVSRVFAATSRIVLGLAVFLLLADVAPLSRGVERWLAAGDREVAQRDFTAAQRDYRRVWFRVGDAVPLYERLLQLSLEARDDNAARTYLYAIAALDGWTSARRDILQGILERSGDVAGAAALFYAGIGAEDDNPHRLRRLAKQQIALHDWGALSNTLSRLYIRLPGEPEVLYWMGIFVAVDDPALAAIYLDQAAADFDWTIRATAVLEALDAYVLRPLTEAHTVLGVTLVGLREWEFAERTLTRAIEVNAINPLALGYLGFVRDQQGRDGLPDLEAALAMSPNDPQLHYLMGLHWRLVDDYAAAHDAFLRAFTYDATNPALAAEIAASLQYLSDLAGAERWYQEAIRLDPGEISWQRALAAFYADTGFRLEEVGFDFIELTSSKEPDDADITASLGWAYYQMRDNEQAYEVLNRAMMQDSTLARVRYYFGMVLEQRGDPQGAADSFWYIIEMYGAEGRFGVLATRALQRLGYLAS